NIVMCILFFFSSRRRHTRSKRDWSSDVCSSDLALSFAIYYPEMVTSLILESASPGLEKPKDQEARQKHDHQLAKRLETEGIDAFVNYWEKIPLFETKQTLLQVIK